jgi:hypothetical protein
MQNFISENQDRLILELVKSLQYNDLFAYHNKIVFPDSLENFNTFVEFNTFFETSENFPFVFADVVNNDTVLTPQEVKEELDFIDHCFSLATNMKDSFAKNASGFLELLSSSDERVIQKIMSYLDFNSFDKQAQSLLINLIASKSFTNLELVCNSSVDDSLNFLLKNSFITLKHLHLKNSSITDNEISAMLTQTKLESLFLSNCSNLIQINIKNSNLKQIFINSCNDTNQFSIINVENLITVKISNCVNLADINLKNCTKLRAISLTNCPSLSSERLLTVTSGKSNLLYIEINDCENIDHTTMKSAFETHKAVFSCKEIKFKNFGNGNNNANILDSEKEQKFVSFASIEVESENSTESIANLKEGNFLIRCVDLKKGVKVLWECKKYDCSFDYNSTIHTHSNFRAGFFKSIRSIFKLLRTKDSHDDLTHSEPSTPIKLEEQAEYSRLNKSAPNTPVKTTEETRRASYQH